MRNDAVISNQSNDISAVPDLRVQSVTQFHMRLAILCFICGTAMLSSAGLSVRLDLDDLLKWSLLFLISTAVMLVVVTRELKGWAVLPAEFSFRGVLPRPARDHEPLPLPAHARIDPWGWGFWGAIYLLMGSLLALMGWFGDSFLGPMLIPGVFFAIAWGLCLASRANAKEERDLGVEYFKEMRIRWVPSSSPYRWYFKTKNKDLM